jgi:acyl dehydratase
MQAARELVFVAGLTEALPRWYYSAAMKTFQTLAELVPLIGQEVVVSDWITITQEKVNLFAQATGDHQWIHVDEERAKAGPFGAPIAHGFLTLSLLPRFFESSICIVQTRMGVNYGLNKVRFIAPVPVGSRLRARMKLLACDPIDNQGMQMTWEVTTERDGSAKPVCIAESIARHYP